MSAAQKITVVCLAVTFVAQVFAFVNLRRANKALRAWEDRLDRMESGR